MSEAEIRMDANLILLRNARAALEAGEIGEADLKIIAAATLQESMRAGIDAAIR